MAEINLAFLEKSRDELLYELYTAVDTDNATALYYTIGRLLMIQDLIIQQKQLKEGNQ